MSYKVEVKSIDEPEYDHRNRLVIVDDSGEREYWDYGEPEDNSFHRDWSWVAEELRRAYEQGVADSKRG